MAAVLTWDAKMGRMVLEKVNYFWWYFINSVAKPDIFYFCVSILVISSCVFP